MNGKKILSFFLSLFALSIAVFLLSRLTPGDPLVSYYGERVERMSAKEKEEARERLGLTAPLPVQYGRWLQNAVQGDFGISYKYKQAVKEVIAERIGNTLLLGGIGFVLTFVLSFFLGLFCAWHEDKPLDRILCKIGTVTGCIPEFWLALILILVFSVQLKLLPSSGAYSIGGQGGVADRAAHLVLPLTVVVLSHLWYYAYMVRNRILEEVRCDYVLLARAKGLTRREVFLRHCVRNVLPSYISLMAISVPHVLGGTYIVETVFSYPGIGTLAYESARYKDYNLLMVVCLLSGALVMLCNLFGQMLSEKLDPRMKAEGSGGQRTRSRSWNKRLGKEAATKGWNRS